MRLCVFAGPGSPALGLWPRTQGAGFCTTAAQSGHQQSGEQHFSLFPPRFLRQQILTRWWLVKVWFWRPDSAFSVCSFKLKRIPISDWCDNKSVIEWAEAKWAPLVWNCIYVECLIWSYWHVSPNFRQFYLLVSALFSIFLLFNKDLTMFV